MRLGTAGLLQVYFILFLKSFGTVSTEWWVSAWLQKFRVGVRSNAGQWGMEECRAGRGIRAGCSPCTGPEPGWLLWLTTNECHGSAFAESHLCCPTACVLQKSYSRNYLKFYLALWEYFWLLCETSQVMPGLCWVEGWHRGHESREDLRRRKCCPLEESCFLLKIHFLHACKRNISLALFPYSMPEVSQLWVWIWRLQLYGHRAGQRCD